MDSDEKCIEKVNFYFNTTHILQHAKKSIAMIQERIRVQEESYLKEKAEKEKQRKVRFQQTQNATDGQPVDIDDEKMTNVDVEIEKVEKDIKKPKLDENEAATTTAIAQSADGNQLVQLPPPQPAPQYDGIELD
eukprot:UN01839